MRNSSSMNQSQCKRMKDVSCYGTSQYQLIRCWNIGGLTLLLSVRRKKNAFSLILQYQEIKTSLLLARKDHEILRPAYRDWKAMGCQSSCSTDSGRRTGNSFQRAGETSKTKRHSSGHPMLAEGCIARYSLHLEENAWHRTPISSVTFPSYDGAY